MESAAPRRCFTLGACSRGVLRTAWTCPIRALDLMVVPGAGRPANRAFSQIVGALAKALGTER
jgi:hypothetical protein